MSAFQSAHGFVIKDSVIVEQLSEGSKGAGLKKLFKACIPGVSHDSSERYPPPLCHPGTRRTQLERLTRWGLSANNGDDRITWLKGPAGVGKSAIAQSCAEALGDKLGASCFFSRPNHRDDPDRFFTSLAYQLAVKYPLYGTFLDNEIYSNPTLVKKSLPHQFHHLFVIPFRDPAIKKEIAERVIIVDGLDECARTEAQADIVKIVAKSVQEKTTPFLWIFFSRLEPRIVATFNLPDVKSVSQQISLPVSRRIDKEILLYLADRFRDIGYRHNLPLPWPSEEKVWALVDFSAGLFACAHAIVLFVDEENPAGPVKQLYAVLRLATHLTTQSDHHPLSTLDGLYTLVMERIPVSMLQTVQWILLTTRIPGIDRAYKSANLLGLSELQLRSACRYLHPVMKIGVGSSARIGFYHTSFMDFLEDPERSKRFCIWSDWAITFLEEIVRHLDQVQVEVNGNGHLEPQLNFIWMHSKATQWACYGDHRRAFFKILYSADLNDGAGRLFSTLTKFDFRRLAFGRWSYPMSATTVEVECLLRNLDSRLKLLRPCPLRNLRASLLSDSTSRYYTIGHGTKKALLEITKENCIYVGPYAPRAFGKWARQLREAPDHHSQDQKEPSAVGAVYPAIPFHSAPLASIARKAVRPPISNHSTLPAPNAIRTEHPPVSNHPAPLAPPPPTIIRRPLSRRNRW